MTEHSETRQCLRPIVLHLSSNSVAVGADTQPGRGFGGAAFKGALRGAVVLNMVSTQS
jgi:hypothetical protein